jgi:mannose-6-phosphate isomerase-like protein (cupin superfamily)
VTVPPNPSPPEDATPFPAGTSVTHLTVYDWTGQDGLAGGSAHVHLACTEGYVVLGGTGRLQTLSRDGFAETPLAPMTVAWFGPGVVHRLINDGGLQILAVMQNGGLPEAGDSVLTFPPEHLAGPGAYRAAAALDTSGEQAAAQSAQRRQQLAVQGFLVLREMVDRDGPAALEEFYAAAAALVRERVPAWSDIWRQGPLAAALRTGEQLGLLAAGRHDHLAQGQLTVLSPPAARSYGMCGRLAAYPSLARGPT